MYHFLDRYKALIPILTATSKQPNSNAQVRARESLERGVILSIGGPFMPRYEWTGGPNILGALDPGVQVSGGSNYTPTPV